MNLKFSISMFVFIEYDDATTSHCLRRYRVLQVLARGIKFLITRTALKQFVDSPTHFYIKHTVKYARHLLVGVKLTTPLG